MIRHLIFGRFMLLLTLIVSAIAGLIHFGIIEVKMPNHDGLLAFPVVEREPEQEPQVDTEPPVIDGALKDHLNAETLAAVARMTEDQGKLREQSRKAFKILQDRINDQQKRIERLERP